MIHSEVVRVTMHERDGLPERHREPLEHTQEIAESVRLGPRRPPPRDRVEARVRLYEHRHTTFLLSRYDREAVVQPLQVCRVALGEFRRAPVVSVPRLLFDPGKLRVRNTTSPMIQRTFSDTSRTLAARSDARAAGHVGPNW